VPQGVTTLPAADYARQRARRAENRVLFLESELAKTLRLLALALKVAARNDCEPIALLTLLELVDASDQGPKQEVAT
jgi:hypothetical protein